MSDVLLVMDFQNGIVERAGSPAVLDAVCAALAAARTVSVPVVFVRVAFRPGYPEAASTNANFGSVAASGEAMTEGHPDTQLHSALAARPDEPVVLKRRVSAFSGSDLDALLRAYRADHLVIAGLSTSGVVLSTVRQAADLDYRLTVLSDACADLDDEVHQVLIEKVLPRQCGVVTTKEWISTL
jgi:nicotinamidase-related amidase